MTGGAGIAGPSPLGIDPHDARVPAVESHIPLHIGANMPAEGAQAMSDAASSQPSCQCSKSGRNLVVCIDGTANQFGVKVRMVVLY
jgi:hypothetical protein